MTATEQTLIGNDNSPERVIADAIADVLHPENDVPVGPPSDFYRDLAKGILAELAEHYQLIPIDALTDLAAKWRREAEGQDIWHGIWAGRDSYQAGVARGRGRQGVDCANDLANVIEHGTVEAVTR